VQRVDPLGSPVLAVDIGGTKVEVAAVDAQGGVHHRHRAPTDAADGEALFEVVAALVGRSRDEAGGATGPGAPVAIGVGCGGPMTADGVSPLNIAQWRDFPLSRRLEERFGLPVHLDNDAKALALGEGRWGAARGVANFMAMVVSTGVGGGIVLDGRLLDGTAGNAGHVGHVVVDPLGRRCPCGARGCLEAQVSGSALAASTGAPAAEAPHELRRRCGRLVGRAAASVGNLLDLELVVVAGSVALGFGEVFFEAAQVELDRLARLEFSRGARIRAAGCGAEGPLLGAAEVARYAAR
jgi:glucokinase